MRFAIHRHVLVAAIFAVACQDATAPKATPDLEVNVPDISAPSAPVALVTDDTLPTDSAPPTDIPEELTRPVTIRNYWTRASVSSMYASAEAYMEYVANQAKQTLTLIVSADGRQIATVPPAVSAASWFLPLWASLRTFSGLQVASECGISAAAMTVHEAKNEWQAPGKSPFLLTSETASSEGMGGQPTCPEQPPKPPALDDGAPSDGDGTGGGGGGDDGGGGDYYYLSCWYALTYVDDVLTEVDQISCTIIS